MHIMRCLYYQGHVTFDGTECSLTALMRSQSLMSLEKCTNLERLTLPKRYYQAGLLNSLVVLRTGIEVPN